MFMRILIVLAALVVSPHAMAQFQPDMWLPAASKTAPKISISPGVLADNAELTIGECWKLGCTLTFDKSCPGVLHDIQADVTVRCNCSSGSACVNESD